MPRGKAVHVVGRKPEVSLLQIPHVRARRGGCGNLPQFKSRFSDLARLMSTPAGGNRVPRETAAEAWR